MWSYVDMSGDCWIWMGSKDRDGYGRYENRPAHRIAYELAGHTLPARRPLHHTCGIKHCVNPGHLQPVTFAEHMAIHRQQRAASSGASG
jgi:hypothetical protein